MTGVIKMNLDILDIKLFVIFVFGLELDEVTSMSSPSLPCLTNRVGAGVALAGLTCRACGAKVRLTDGEQRLVEALEDRSKLFFFFFPVILYYDDI